MGFIDIFSKKNIQHDADVVHSKLVHLRESVSSSFSSLRSDMGNHREWIIYLNNIQGSLKKAYDEHRLLTKKDINRINKWLYYLNERTKKQDERIAVLEKHIKLHAENNHENLTKLFERVNELTRREESLKDMVLTEVKGVKDSHDETRKQFDLITKKVEKMPKETIIPDSSLTNPEQKLLNLMLSESDPISYSTVAEKTGNSINTVRVIMNNLKKRGLVEENVLPSGVKLFSAINKEKIKKLYNIQHL